jgi:hypothetical protein
MSSRKNGGSDYWLQVNTKGNKYATIIIDEPFNPPLDSVFCSRRIKVRQLLVTFLTIDSPISWTGIHFLQERASRSRPPLSVRSLYLTIWVLYPMA